MELAEAIEILDEPRIREALLNAYAADAVGAWAIVKAELESRGAAIEQVRELHRPEGVGLSYCGECTDAFTEPWPYPTIAALDGKADA